MGRGFESWVFPQLELTALKSNRHLGYATITHPFHPLRGTSLKVLSSKTFNNRDILSLQGTTRGVIAIPRDWTDKGDPNPYSSLGDESLPLLSFAHLQQLADLISILGHASSEETCLKD
jgi:hypothetical protein